MVERLAKFRQGGPLNAHVLLPDDTVPIRILPGNEGEPAEIQTGLGAKVLLDDGMRLMAIWRSTRAIMPPIRWKMPIWPPSPECKVLIN